MYVEDLIKYVGIVLVTAVVSVLGTLQFTRGHGTSPTPVRVVAVGPAPSQDAQEEADAAAIDIRAAIPAIEAYNADNGGYSGMTAAALRAIDPAIKSPPAFSVKSAGVTTYCVEAMSGAEAAYKTESTDILYGSCP